MYKKIKSLLQQMWPASKTSTDNSYPRWITIQADDSQEPSGFLRYPALLIGADTAAYISNEELELHYVKPTNDPQLFDYFSSAYPVIYVGVNDQSVYQDLAELTAAEFLSKYPCYSLQGSMAKHLHLCTLARQGGDICRPR